MEDIKTGISNQVTNVIGLIQGWKLDGKTTKISQLRKIQAAINGLIAKTKYLIQDYQEGKWPKSTSQPKPQPPKTKPQPPKKSK